MLRVLIPVVLVLAAGCVGAVTTTGPDGKPAYVIDCDMESQACFDKAADLCPGGYYQLERKNGETELPHTAGVVATPHTQLLIQCRKP